MIEGALPLLVQMNLVFFTTKDDIGFITSDHPCIWFDPEAGRRPPMLQSKTIEVTMPLSPSCLAVLSWEDFPDYRHATSFEVDIANQFRQAACEEYFVVRRNVTKPIWFT